ncbi:MAG: hypothetical protein IJP04_07365 [Clostridia bacterium]|nr:hypothetical protein [Clostridia bacterium]
MALYQWRQNAQGSQLLADGRLICTLPAEINCTDTFENIGEGAWRWIRKCDQPVEKMRLLLQQAEKLTYWQVPSVNYNGNGWGSGAQYSGFGCDGENWTYAWHRVAIPACTYAEEGEWAVSLFGEEKGGMSCSIWEEDGCARQALLWPEVEGPKCLSKRCWRDPFQGTMDPCDTFVALVHVTPVSRKGRGYQKLLDFAWEYYKRPVKMEKSPEELVRLETAFNRTLYREKMDGLVGFSSALVWTAETAMFRRVETFQIGWVGQNASRACFFLERYLQTGDESMRDKGIKVLDSWVKHAKLPSGLMYVALIAPPDDLVSVDNHTIPMDLDACNLGTAATYFFKAYRLAKECGLDKPEYLKMGADLCDFALKTMKPSGELAKTWFIDGTVDNPHGSVAAFYTLSLFDAYETTGEEKYKEGALRSFNFYNDEFQKNGFTTAGALDSYCIDKESAAPLLRAALKAYHITGDKKYIDDAVDIAYYLNTWMWFYSIDFPEGSALKQLNYDSFGSTSVSAAHNALDPYGVYYVPEYLELAELTGNEMWREQARALWYNGIQCISDGTLVIDDHVFPAGGQVESWRHTRWCRTDMRYHVTSGHMVSWMGAFRMVALSLIKDWDQLR